MDNFLTIDVEAYFHVSAFEIIVTKEQWPAYECRVVPNTIKVLNLFDRYGVKATFFVLGWVAEHYPDLVAEIDRRGHEIDSFQPKIRTQNILSRVRHYVNLSRTLPRLDLLLQDFSFRGIS